MRMTTIDDEFSGEETQSRAAMLMYVTVVVCNCVYS